MEARAENLTSGKGKGAAQSLVSNPAVLRIHNGGAQWRASVSPSVPLRSAHVERWVLGVMQVETVIHLSR